MNKKQFQNFCDKHYKTIQLFETVAMVIFVCLVAFLITEKYFLNYKVVLVEQDLNGEYNVVKEIIVNGKITDSHLFINTSLPEHDKPKYILDTKYQVDAMKYTNNEFLYNIST